MLISRIKMSMGSKDTCCWEGGATVFKTVPSIASVYINVAPIVPIR